MDSRAYVRVMSHDSSSRAIVKLPTPLEKYVLYYKCCMYMMACIQQAYGLVICLLHGITMVAIRG